VPKCSYRIRFIYVILPVEGTELVSRQRAARAAASLYEQVAPQCDGPVIWIQCLDSQLDLLNLQKKLVPSAPGQSQSRALSESPRSPQYLAQGVLVEEPEVPYRLIAERKSARGSHR
jgi:hypothetical protein